MRHTMTPTSLVTLRHLRAFLALSHERHFTRAAARMHLSQPAFSALIRALEAELGLQLFDRTTRQVALTPEGVQFEPAARRALGEVDAALAFARERAALERGRVSIALLPSLAADWLPPVLVSFRAAHPGIETEVHDVLSDACVEHVLSGRADFALAATRAATRDLQAERFCSDDFHLVCRADHPLARVERLRAADLARHPFIQMSRTSSVRQSLEQGLRSAPLQTVMEVDQLATVMGMVRAGVGISVVPAMTLFHFTGTGIVARRLPLRGLRRTLYLITRRERSLSRAAAAFKALALASRPRPA